MIRGGQGRTARELEAASSALVWFWAIGAALVGLIYWIKGGAS